MKTAKVFFDCICTAKDPGKCSTTIQFYRIVQHVLYELNRKDVFFYWQVPHWAMAENPDFYPKHPNIKYIEVDQHKDRTYEYVVLREPVARNMMYGGDYWDADVIVTNRAGLAAQIKMLSVTPRANKYADMLRNVWILEEMPLMSFKQTVMDFANFLNDPFTLNGYMAADKAWVCSYHEPKGIVDIARKHLTPAKQRQLREKVQPFIPSVPPVRRLKSPDKFYKGGDDKLCIAYIGRMEKANNIDGIKDVMVKQFIMKGTKVDLLVCTVSQVVKSFTDLFDVRFASRDEFWDHCKNRIHVVLKMSKSSGYNASMMEPLFMGVPIIVLKADWAVGLLGEDYPFYVKNETEAYALLNVFAKDYAKQYEKFSKWYQEWLEPTYDQRFADDLLQTKFIKELDEYIEWKHGEFSSSKSMKEDNEVYNLIADAMGEEGVLFDVLKKMAEDRVLTMMGDKVDDDRLDAINMIWMPNFMEMKMVLMDFFGFVDASATPGHMKKVSK